MRYIKLDEVLKMTGRGRTATYKDIQLGKFPKQVKVGSSSLWIESEVLEWMKEKAAKRPQ